MITIMYIFLEPYTAFVYNFFFYAYSENYSRLNREFINLFKTCQKIFYLSLHICIYKYLLYLDD